MSNRFRKQRAKEIARARQRGSGNDAAENPITEILDQVFEDELEAMAPPAPTGPVRHVEYQIQFEPMKGEWDHLLTPEAEKKLRELSASVVQRGKPRIAELEELLLAHPDVPPIYNHLHTSYTLAGRIDDAERLCRLCYERFPDYIYGAMSYVHLCIQEGRIEDALKVFEGRRSIDLFLKGRTEIHGTEFAVFHVTLGLLEVEQGNFGIAKRHLDTVMKVVPQARGIDLLQARLRKAMVPRVVDRLTQRMHQMRLEALGA